ncbi:uncharacterized protein LOC123875886 [Maniola jurtina]|uniref:uncharacterized protein LOC123875886 n=1 Tax=Maniola jurtina TaxID=191418 RepID=UPI001E686A04|nr:uncharacterized protein LOC123875886 [Maniola jurtina]
MSKDVQGTSASSPPGDSKGNESTNHNNVFKVGVRVPPFWPEEPEIWFAQVEGQFAISGITNDATKFNYVIGHLENQHSKEVKDIIINPPASNKYDKLKGELIRRLTASNEKKIKQLLMHEELGDRKPSAFLRHLTGLAGADVPDDFLKTIWISRLPHGIQTVLAGQPAGTALEDLADLADRVNDLASSTPKVASLANEVPSSLISDLTKGIAELRKQVQQMATQRNSRSRSRTSQGTRNSSRQRTQSNYRKFPLCWYHSKYGDKARTCVRPCDFKSENSMGGR